jgi:hypothetical protein
MILFRAIFPSDLTALFGQFLAGRLLQYSLEKPHSRIIESEADSVGLMLSARV